MARGVGYLGAGIGGGAGGGLGGLLGQLHAGYLLRQAVQVVLCVLQKLTNDLELLACRRALLLLHQLPVALEVIGLQQ